MTTVSLLAHTNEDFDYARLLTVESLAYPLSDGVVRMQMRRSSDSPLVYFEWSTENGRLSLQPTTASGWVAFAANPADGETITIGETAVTFRASPSAALDVQIAPDLDATLVNLRAKLAASSDPDIAAQSYTVTDSRLDLIAKTDGATGNLMTLATSAAKAAVSAATLLGGGTLLVLFAAQPLIGRFLGPYVFDVLFLARADDGTLSPQARLLDGTLTFAPGVTR